MIQRRLAALAATLAVLAPVAAQAHDSFIIAPARVEAGRPFTVQVTSSGFFPEPETAIRPERVSRLSAHSGAQPLDGVFTAGAVALQLELTPPGEDGAVVGVSLSPRDIDVGSDELVHYMDEIGAGPDLRTAVTAAAARDGVLRETYTKHLKTLVCGADCSAVRASGGAGLPYEFVPAAGRQLILLRDGATVPAGQPVFVTTEAQGRQALVTDAQGSVSLPAGLTGPVLVMAVALSPPTEPGARFTSEWAALTFDARLFED